MPLGDQPGTSNTEAREIEEAATKTIAPLAIEVVVTAETEITSSEVLPKDKGKEKVTEDQEPEFLSRATSVPSSSSPRVTARPFN